MRIDVSGSRIMFPPECACCCDIADTLLQVSATKTRGKRVIHTSTNVWDVPYCSRCVRHVKAAEFARSLALFFAALSVVACVYLWNQVNSTTGATFGILGLACTAGVYGFMISHARSDCAASCARLGKAMAYLGWHGTLHQFEVVSRQFATDFMAANQKKLVNLSAQARSLLAKSGSAEPPNAPRSPRRYVS
jgi:hypothetical protein